MDDEIEEICYLGREKLWEAYLCKSKTFANIKKEEWDEQIKEVGQLKDKCLWRPITKCNWPTINTKAYEVNFGDLFAKI